MPPACQLDPGVAADSPGPDDSDAHAAPPCEAESGLGELLADRHDDLGVCRHACPKISMPHRGAGLESAHAVLHALAAGTKRTGELKREVRAISHDAEKTE